MARCSRSTGVSEIVSPARAASAVIAVSQPNPAASGKHLCPRALRQPPLARERLLCVVAGCEPDQPPRRLLRDAEAAALPARERRDGQVALALEQRPQVAAEVGVAEQELALARDPLAERERLSLAAVRQAKDECTGGLGHVGCGVARAVVGDDHLRVRELPPQLLDRRPDPLRLVAGGDQDRERAHPLVAGSGSIGGRILSAVSRTP